MGSRHVDVETVHFDSEKLEGRPCRMRSRVTEVFQDCRAFLAPVEHMCLMVGKLKQRRTVNARVRQDGLEAWGIWAGQ